MRLAAHSFTTFRAAASLARQPLRCSAPVNSDRLDLLASFSSRLLGTMASSAAKRLAGKTILVTGASSGIGRSTALEFARTSPQDLRLILTARRIDSLREVAAQIAKEVGDGVKVLPVKLDVSNPDEVRGFVGGLPEEWRDINVLVNNA